MMDQNGLEIDRPSRIVPRSASGSPGRDRRNFVILVAAVMALIGLGQDEVRAAPQVSEEYQIKAAFLYNFIKFVEWPKDRFSGDKDPIVIGVVGKDPFGEVLD